MTKGRFLFHQGRPTSFLRRFHSVPTFLASPRSRAPCRPSTGRILPSSSGLPLVLANVQAHARLQSLFGQLQQPRGYRIVEVPLSAVVAHQGGNAFHHQQRALPVHRHRYRYRLRLQVASLSSHAFHGRFLLKSGSHKDWPNRVAPHSVHPSSMMFSKAKGQAAGKVDSSRSVSRAATSTASPYASAKA